MKKETPGYIYHITTVDEWDAAVRKGSYAAASLVSEGFIHCCTREQLDGVRERYFKGKTNLLVLYIKASNVRAPLRVEQSGSTGEFFPHIYGVITPDEVDATERL